MWALNKARQRAFIVTRWRDQTPGIIGGSQRGPLPEIKFFPIGALTIGGCQVRGMRHSMGGVPGLELSGPWQDRHTVKAALVQPVMPSV